MDVLNGLEVMITLDRGYLRGVIYYFIYQTPKKREAIVTGAGEDIGDWDTLKSDSLIKEETVNGILRALYD